jgi:hypothetical protein
MRSAPPLQVTVERFDLWNALLGGLAVLVLLVAGAWFASGHHELHWWGSWLMGGGTLGALLALMSGARQAPIGLRWDSQHWYCGAYGDSGREDGPWRVRVPIDWGGFMLLRLEPPDGIPRLSSRWLPLRRSGVRGDWHALRCALGAHTAQAARSTAGSQ